MFLYIFDFIFTKWKIFYHSQLFPRSAKNIKYIYIYIYIHYPEVNYISLMPIVCTTWKNVNDLYYFQKLQSVFISTKWKNWRHFLWLFIYLILLPQSKKYCTNTFYSHEVKTITWLFWWLYISPMHIISRKWKKALMIYLASI